jgi:hypothetical protein
MQFNHRADDRQQTQMDTDKQSLKTPMGREFKRAPKRVFIFNAECFFRSEFICLRPWLNAACACVLLLAVARATGGETTNQPAPAFLDVVAAHFAAWDTNHDRTLSTQELDAAIENPANQGPVAAALATLRKAGLATNAPPLTLAGIRKLADDNDLKLRAFYSQSLARIKRVTHRELFASGLPQLTTIHQGRMGNCFCLAPLGAMLYRDPREVASWFEVQSNGNILVKLAAGPVSVPPPTDAELAFASGNSQDGTWVNLYEKAIGEARNERNRPGRRFAVSLDAISQGGAEAPILSYITGHKVSVFPLKFGPKPEAAGARMAQLRQNLADATSNKLLMVCATVKPSTPALTPKHAYALLDYDAQADTVKLWNPHGNYFKPKGQAGLTNGYFTTNGLFTMPLTDFTNQFTRVILERPELTPLQWPDQWELLAEAGRFGEAATDLAEVIASDQSQDARRLLLAPLLLQSGRLGDYAVQCQYLLDHFGKTSNATMAQRVAMICLLQPSALGRTDLARAAELAGRAVTLPTNGVAVYWRWMTRGFAEYRTERYDDALKTEALAQKAAAHVSDTNAPACEADTCFISALAHEKLKDQRRAHRDWEQGLKLVRTKLPKISEGDLGPRWYPVLVANLLMHEAGGTVAGAAVVAQTPSP